MKKRNLLPQISAPVERSTNATSHGNNSQGNILPSWAVNRDFLFGYGAAVADIVSPFAGDDAE